MIEGRDLAVIRGEQILFAHLNLRLGEGDVLRLLGPNGSGKTTLLRVLCGLTEADAGEVLWRGKSLLTQRADFNEAVLFLGHKTGLTPELSARENLAILCGLRGGVTDAAIEDALLDVGLASRVDQPVVTLSAGQQQRVKLARLTLSPAALWVLDEPLTALDVSGQQWLEHQIDHHSERGGSTLVTTHQELGRERGHWGTLSLDDFQHEANNEYADNGYASNEYDSE